VPRTWRAGSPLSRELLAELVTAYSVEMSNSDLSEDDLFGHFILDSGSQERFHGYYETLMEVRSLLASTAWQSSVTGCYVNSARSFRSLRLSFFTREPEKARAAVTAFCGSTSVEVLEEGQPQRQRVSAEYGGEELRFRNFLSTYSPLGLDIMERDLLYAKRLLATFRWRVMRARESYRQHFEGTLATWSATWSTLSEAQRAQWWSDLGHWPNPPQVDWAHMLVNMVLGCDWNSAGTWRGFLDPKPPLPLDKLNATLEELSFEIPQDWRPL